MFRLALLGALGAVISRGQTPRTPERVTPVAPAATTTASPPRVAWTVESSD